MSSTDCVEQKGIIEEIKDGIAKVNITSFSACSSCQSQSACQMGETAEKVIDVHIDTSKFHKGELVRVIMKKSLGLKATLLAYIIPFIILLLSLIVLTSIGFSEGVSGIISILLLVPYYIVLYLLKNTLQKTFQFTLNKVS